MYMTKSFVIRAEDYELIKKNARDLGLNDSAFIKLCILVASQELKLRDDYTFKYSFLRWYKPKDLIEEIKREERKKVDKEEKKVEEKTEEKTEPPKPKGKIKIQL